MTTIIENVLEIDCDCSGHIHAERKEDWSVPVEELTIVVEANYYGGTGRVIYQGVEQDYSRRLVEFY